MIEILSFGAGVQSTTLLLMSCKGILPKLDRVIFADTQWEPAAVYRHLLWCTTIAAEHGITVDVRTYGNLRTDLLASFGRGPSGKQQASIPVFLKNEDGSRGIIRRQCTQTYKIDVVEKYVRQAIGLKPRQRWPLEPQVRMWIGISQDEIGRMRASLRPTIQMWHPLIEADELARKVPGRMFPIGMSRRDCLDWLKANNFPIPQRSACIGCPYRSNENWRQLTDDEFADACEVDQLLRIERPAIRGEVYLHSSLTPLGQADFCRADDPAQGLDNECVGVCGV